MKFNSIITKKEKIETEEKITSEEKVGRISRMVFHELNPTWWDISNYNVFLTAHG